MKRVLIMAFAVMALAVPLARAAFASEADLSDVARPVDEAAAMLPVQSWQTATAVRSQAAVIPQVLPEPLRHEGN